MRRTTSSGGNAFEPECLRRTRTKTIAMMSPQRISLHSSERFQKSREIDCTQNTKSQWTVYVRTTASPSPSSLWVGGEDDDGDDGDDDEEATSPTRTKMMVIMIPMMTVMRQSFDIGEADEEEPEDDDRDDEDDDEAATSTRTKMMPMMIPMLTVMRQSFDIGEADEEEPEDDDRDDRNWSRSQVTTYYYLVTTFQTKKFVQYSQVSFLDWASGQGLAFSHLSAASGS